MKKLFNNDEIQRIFQRNLDVYCCLGVGNLKPIETIYIYWFNDRIDFLFTSQHCTGKKLPMYRNAFCSRGSYAIDCKTVVIYSDTYEKELAKKYTILYDCGYIFNAKIFKNHLDCFCVDSLDFLIENLLNAKIISERKEVY